MTQQQKQNIGRGVRAAMIRKKRSDAMKASWIRRRAGNGEVTGGCINIAPEPKRHQESLWEVAKVLGIDTDEVIRDEVRKALGI